MQILLKTDQFVVIRRFLVHVLVNIVGLSQLCVLDFSSVQLKLSRDHF